MTKIFLAGHNGMVGSAILRKLKNRGEAQILTRERNELDLTDQQSVRSFMQREKPDLVIIAAAKVGGILANNSFPAEFIYQNLMIECNLIHQSFEAGVKKLLQLGSSCIYPRNTPQPMKEEALLTGTLEPTNEAYAIAKISGIKLCESYNRQYGTDYRSVMPTNLYGPGDNFHPKNSHVLPALIRKFHEAVVSKKDTVIIWGNGEPRREFLHVDDMADASLLVLELPREQYYYAGEATTHLNIGCGHDITISDLAHLIAGITDFSGKIIFDTTKPNGMPRKLMDVERILATGWKPSIRLEKGIADTYRWFAENIESIKN